MLHFNIVYATVVVFVIIVFFNATSVTDVLCRSLQRFICWCSSFYYCYCFLLYLLSLLQLIQLFTTIYCCLLQLHVIILLLLLYLVRVWQMQRNIKNLPQLYTPFFLPSLCIICCWLGFIEIQYNKVSWNWKSWGCRWW